MSMASGGLSLQLGSMVRLVALFIVADCRRCWCSETPQLSLKLAYIHGRSLRKVALTPLSPPLVSSPLLSSSLQKSKRIVIGLFMERYLPGRGPLSCIPWNHPLLWAVYKSVMQTRGLWNRKKSLRRHAVQVFHGQSTNNKCIMYTSNFKNVVIYSESQVRTIIQLFFFYYNCVKMCRLSVHVQTTGTVTDMVNN